jgi:hypothetical protein
MGLIFKGSLLALHANIRLGQKCLAATNALAYNFAIIISTVKWFIAAASEGC